MRPLELSPNNLYNEKAEDTMVVNTIITESTNTEAIQDIKIEPTTSEMELLSSSASVDNNQPLEINQSEMENTTGQDNIAVDPLATLYNSTMSPKVNPQTEEMDGFTVVTSKRKSKNCIKATAAEETKI
ncbi:7537_t:CDS:1 [Ambispora leptoticha]|uniref:7537_t:CDS:1 n=1 Tax=Ambispora leptoticha TaxID=144679 RepID=A0A9N9EY90_9GLOM|nr:7537_t:CDS:1 [Ambispora leptoticha]